MNDLERIFYANTENLIHKWKHYFEIYDRHFSRFRGSDVTVLEMGVGQGGSLRMWRSYFGPRARIVGVDINPECAALAGDQIEILLANQDDRESLRALKAKVPHVDILIDDGGHTMQQQINTFEELFPHVDAHGVYLCEDLHTSYWPDWGGGFRKDDTLHRDRQAIDRSVARMAFDECGRVARLGLHAHGALAAFLRQHSCGREAADAAAGAGADGSAKACAQTRTEEFPEVGRVGGFAWLFIAAQTKNPRSFLIEGLV